MKKQNPFSRPGVIIALIAGVYLLRFWVSVPLTLLRFVIGYSGIADLLGHILRTIWP